MDIDTDVVRRCRRVLCPGGWMWQIIGAAELAEWDYCIETDSTILSECGSDLDYFLVDSNESSQA